MLRIFLSFADVDFEAFRRAPRNERNYIIFIALGILISVLLAAASTFSFMRLFTGSGFIGFIFGSIVGALIYFLHRTLLRDTNRIKLYAFLILAVLEGSLLSIPFKVASMKPYLEKQIVEQVKKENDQMYSDLVLSAEREFAEKKEKIRRTITEYASDSENISSSKGAAAARREEKTILANEETALAEAKARFESLKAEPDISPLGLVDYFVTTMFSAEASVATIFANIALLFFFMIFEAAPVLIRLLFNEDTSIYLRAVEHKTQMATKGFVRIMDIDNKVLDSHSLSDVKTNLMEKRIWDQLTLLLSQDNPDPGKVEQLVQDIAVIENHKRNGSSSSYSSGNAQSNGVPENEEPEFDYSF